MAVQNTRPEPIFPQRELRPVPPVFLVLLFALLAAVVFFVVAG